MQVDNNTTTNNIQTNNISILNQNTIRFPNIEYKDPIWIKNIAPPTPWLVDEVITVPIDSFVYITLLNNYIVSHQHTNLRITYNGGDCIIPLNVNKGGNTQTQDFFHTMIPLYKGTELTITQPLSGVDVYCIPMIDRIANLTNTPTATSNVDSQDFKYLENKVPSLQTQINELVTKNTLLQTQLDDVNSINIQQETQINLLTTKINDNTENGNARFLKPGGRSNTWGFHNTKWPTTSTITIPYNSYVTIHNYGDGDEFKIQIDDGNTKWYLPFWGEGMGGEDDRIFTVPMKGGWKISPNVNINYMQITIFEM